MAEETEQETGAEAAGNADPIALGIAMGRTSAAVDGEMIAYLRDQRHHLNEQRELLLSRLRLGRFSDRVKAGLQVMTGLVAAVIVVGLIAAAWNASQADGMVVDAFSVPPKFAQDGITGEIVADDLTDRISAIRNIAVNNSISSSKDVSKDSTEDVTVEIPETGVSLGQAWRYLRLWLGHERHLNGNLRLTGEGNIALTVTLDGERVAVVRGAPGDLDRLEQQAAEQVFASIDPLNIVLYMSAQGRVAEALAAAGHNAQVAVGPVDRADAYALWASTTRNVAGDMALAMARGRIAAALDPKLMAPRRETMLASVMMGHNEEVLRQAQAMQGLREEDQPKNMQGPGFAELAAEGTFDRDAALGNFAQAASEDPCLMTCTQTTRFLARAEYAARAHDGAASRAQAAEAATGPLAGVVLSTNGFNIARVRYFSDANVEDWPAAVTAARTYEADIKADSTILRGMKAARLLVQAPPLLAYALARGGDPAGAQAVVDATPLDCYDCIRMRGNIAAVEKNWDGTDHWFADAVGQAPSIPFAYADWGQSLLARGDADGAIAKFTIANQKGPHFADPLEMWGEALMKQNRSDRALAKFAEAAKYAPNWGRLHLKWGEALGYAGRKDEAQAQLAMAAGLDLSDADKAELARQMQSSKA